MPKSDLRSRVFSFTGSIYSFQGKEYSIMECKYTFIPSKKLKKLFLGYPKGSMFLLKEVEGCIIPTGPISGARIMVGDHYLYLHQHEDPFSVPTYIEQYVWPVHRMLLTAGGYFTQEEDVIGYYKNPDDANKPFTYLDDSHQRSSEYLYALIKSHCPDIARVLEIGCNSGRNMAYLKERMDVAVDGMEINEEAIQLLYKTHPSLNDSKVHKGNMVDMVGKIKGPGYDLVFSMASLQCLHPTVSNKFWQKLAHLSCKYFITIEMENGFNDRYFARNYKEIFVSARYRELFSEHIQDKSLNIDNYQTRVFKRI